MAMKLVAGLFIELQRVLVFLISGQTDRLGAFKQHRGQAGQTILSVSFATLLGMDMHAFKVSGLRSLSDDVGFEYQTVVLCPNPDPALFNPSRGARAKAAGIALHWICASFLN